jgi:CheY-like chemotaxis protein
MRINGPILLVEDSGAKTAVARHTLDDLGIGDHVVSADVPEALTYLKAPNEQRPCVVLLSVDESGDEGLAMLQTIKQDDQLRSIPVVVLGPSGDSRMVNESFGLGAAGYMVRSLDSLEFSETIRALYAYWNLSELPK